MAGRSRTGTAWKLAGAAFAVVGALVRALLAVSGIGSFGTGALERTREFQARSQLPLPYMGPTGPSDAVVDEWFDERRLPRR